MSPVLVACVGDTCAVNVAAALNVNNPIEMSATPLVSAQRVLRPSLCVLFQFTAPTLSLAGRRPAPPENPAPKKAWSSLRHRNAGA
jgi:hypothetical protein